MRRILFILIIVLLVVLAAFAGWYAFFRNPNIPLEESIVDILPFGSGDDVNAPVTEETNTRDAAGTSPIVDKYALPSADLYRISDTPVAGAVAFERGGGTTVRYVDRATGHIYDADLATLTKTKVTNQTLPKIYEGYFRSDGNAVLLRSLNDSSDVVSNLSLALTPPKATSSDELYTVSSTAFRGDISAITVGSGNSLIYALKDTKVIVSSTFGGTAMRTLLTSPFTDWRLNSAGNSLVAYTKASVSAPGYAYTLNSSSGGLSKILGPFNGLAAVQNSSGNRVIYSYVENNTAKTSVKNLTSKVTSVISPVTLAEKCIWSVKGAGFVICGVPSGGVGAGEPDSWYRGATHFSDRIWLFDTIADLAQVLAEPKSLLGVDIDVSDPKLSPNENYLIFTNKTDLTLWALKLGPF